MFFGCIELSSSRQKKSFVSGYTIAVMHANFVLYLFPLPTKSTDEQTYRYFYQSCQVYLRRIFRRICFSFIVFMWAFSFTSVIPLLYTIDSNEKDPEAVFCLGLNQKKTYRDEWFDRSRPLQTIVINLIPFLINFLLLSIVIGKLLYECLGYFYFHLEKQLYRLFRRRDLSNNIILEPFHRWFVKYFFRFLFLCSTCLLACIYPIVMRFYLIYFSAFIPLMFVIFNYIFVRKSSSNEQPVVIENENITLPIEQIELQPTTIANLLAETDPKQLSFTNRLYDKP